MNAAGFHSGLLRSGPADAIAEIANRVLVCARRRIQPCLAGLARECSHATRRHYWHVAGVEVGAEGHHARRTRRTAVRRCVGIAGIVERAVFFNDPAEVTRSDCGFRGSIDEVHERAVALREDQGDSSTGRTHYTLRVLRFVGEAVSSSGGGEGRYPAPVLDPYARSDRRTSARPPT